MIRKGYGAGGYRGTDGLEKPLPLAGLVDMKMEGGFFEINPLAEFPPEPEWDLEYSNLGKGRARVTRDRYLTDGEVTTCIDNDIVQRQMTKKHQNGYQATDVGAHGTQWYDVNMLGFNKKTIDMTPEAANYEGSRFQYGRYDVPSNLGYGLQGATSTLQRQKQFTTTGYTKLQGKQQSGWYAGRKGDVNRLGVNPDNVKQID